MITGHDFSENKNVIPFNSISEKIREITMEEDAEFICSKYGVITVLKKSENTETELKYSPEKAIGFPAIKDLIKKMRGEILPVKKIETKTEIKTETDDALEIVVFFDIQIGENGDDFIYHTYFPERQYSEDLYKEYRDWTAEKVYNISGVKISKENKNFTSLHANLTFDNFDDFKKRDHEIIYHAVAERAKNSNKKISKIVFVFGGDQESKITDKMISMVSECFVYCVEKGVMKKTSHCNTNIVNMLG